MGDDPKSPEYDWGVDDEEEARPSRPLRPVSSRPAAGPAAGRKADDPLERLKALGPPPPIPAPEPARVISLPARLPGTAPADEPASAPTDQRATPEGTAAAPFMPRPAATDSDYEADGHLRAAGPAEGATESDGRDRETEKPLLFARVAASSAAARASGEQEEEETFGEEDYDKNDEPFERPDAEKLGIVGGKGVGKSYLFQSMVYRTYTGQQSGALTYYLERDSIRLFTATTRADGWNTLNRSRFIKQYAAWHRLPQTTLLNHRWYRLRLLYRTGWLGGKRSALDVEFFDGSGEGFFQAEATSAETRKLWREGYSKARVMVFCLPLWAAFPGPDLTDEDWAYRDMVLEGFEQVVQNYVDVRTRFKPGPVTSILALTMADDRRCALRTLYDQWISPYMDSPHTYLKQLKKGSGVARYLANARKVSQALLEEFAAARDPRVSDIPQSLDFDRGKPWIVPLSAVEGARLDHLEQKYRAAVDDPARQRETRIAPVPVHVELPLLVALCERENALM